VEGAVAPSRPSAPDRPKLLWLAVLAAVVAGLGAAGVSEWLDASMRGPEDASALGVPVLAAIPRIGPRGRRAP
jgi:capsular polysaccharide biosynthesis protein